MAHDPTRPIGLIVNPRSGNDVRRVVASAGTSTLEDKASIVRRVVRGAIAGGATRFVTHHEPHHIVRRATETMRGVTIDRLDDPIDNTEADTTRAAERLRDLGCAVVVVLGGDGTNRAAAKGWPGIPVIPLSTGTNNAFPYWVEPTVAGVAAGLLATGAVDDGPAVARVAKIVTLRLDDDDGDEIALIDAVAVDDPFVGSLELFDPDTLICAVLTRSDPAGIGFTAVGGLLEPCSADDDAGVLVRFAPAADHRGPVLRAPTAPGHFADIGIVECRRLALDEEVVLDGPAVLAFDGERKRRVRAGRRAVISVRRAGPRVVDVGAVMAAAARDGTFVRQSGAPVQRSGDDR